MVDSGGIERVQCVAKQGIPGVTPSYTWEITKPDATIVSGSGSVATVIADEPGTYSCEFTASANRNCPPPEITLSPEVKDLIFTATLSVSPSSIPATTAWPDMPAGLSESEVTVEWDPPECEGTLEIVELGLTNGYQPPSDGTITPDPNDDNLWNYTAFDEPITEKCPERVTVSIAAKQGSSEIAQASVVVRPTFKWWVSGHKHSPGGIMHSPQPDDYLNAYDYIRWKYATMLATTGGTFATVNIATTQTLECGNVSSAAACTTKRLLSNIYDVVFGLSTFTQGENVAASIIGHELLHASGVFSECTAYRWESEHIDGTGLTCNPTYIRTVLDYLLENECP